MAAGVGGWCNLCGGLRGGQGGAERSSGKASGDTSQPQDVPDKEARRLALRERARARAQQSAHLTDAQKEERRMARKLEIADGAAIHREKGKRKAAECTTCGAGWTRPRPERGTVEAFAGARRTRRQVLEAEREKEARLEAEADAAAEAQADEDGISEPAPEEPPTPALLSHRPYSHIPTSSPNLPSYPPPPPVKTPTPGAGSDAAGKKKRKVKKSGLSKLLAENKERSQAAQGSGMWGLG
ncbi:hypothetical protein IAT38_006794 [Cryptococcus sp. DSM 104549]